jgi:iron complex outermembrane recepter protein
MFVCSAWLRTACARLSAVGCAMAVSIAFAGPANDASEGADLSDLSFDELASMPVADATRRPSSRPAASVHVITQDEIRRSGATTLPDALRAVPGLVVQQIDASRWSISIRGFSARFANKVQVLVDGQSLYTPSYGGVYWDANDTFLDDIERIEITRGPGDASTPMNGINGTINVITKHADQTQGAFFNSDIGMDHPGSAALRYGGSANGSDTRWRSYAKYSKRDHNEDLSGKPTHDEWEQARIGARMDFELSESDDLRVNVDAYDGSLGQDASPGLSLTWLAGGQYGPRTTAREQMRGISISTALTKHGDAARSTLQAFATHSDRSAVVSSERRTAAALEFDQTRTLTSWNDLHWGLRAHFNDDYLDHFSPKGREQWAFDAYAQDVSYFFDDRLALSLGARLEDTPFDGMQLSPNARITIAPTASTSAWAAISRAVRTPTRLEHDARLRLEFPPNSLPQLPNFPQLALLFSGNDRIRSESLLAYEAGFQFDAKSAWALDASAFFNDYRHLTITQLDDLVCGPAGISITQDLSCPLRAQTLTGIGRFDSSNGGETYGGEIALTWRPWSNWRLVGSYATVRGNVNSPAAFRPQLARIAQQLFGFMKALPPPVETPSGSSLGLHPKDQYGLQSLFNISPHWDFDLLWRRNSSLPFGIPAYSELNARLAWRPSRDVEIAIVGSNLLNSSHQEGVSNYLEILPTRIQRSVFAQLRWAF